MSDTEFDVVIAAYLIPDLAQKEALVKLVEDKQLDGRAHADGTAVKETGDPDAGLEAAAESGWWGECRQVRGLEEKMGAALPPGSAGIVAIYDRAKTDTVNTTLASAVRKSVAQVDGGGAKELKAALAEAQTGMGG